MQGAFRKAFLNNIALNYMYKMRDFTSIVALTMFLQGLNRIEMIRDLLDLFMTIFFFKSLLFEHIIVKPFIFEQFFMCSSLRNVPIFQNNDLIKVEH